MTYLLDTNACIALMNGKPASVSSRFQKAAEAGSQFFVPSVVAFELWYGVAKSRRPAFNTSRVETFFRGPVQLLTFDEQDARTTGSVRAAMEAIGRPLGAYDLLIAGQALRHKMTLITANVKEFSRVKGLLREDWAA
ncbi:MAG: type II toxin-antitoxin system VapC family toxin [Acidobacteria bacterium]|nr:type II toxin-antitoxin system VapC family toxin [Acidobacteriota bacterium]